MQQLVKTKARVFLIITVALIMIIISAPITYSFNPAIQRSVKKIYYKIQNLKEEPATIKLDVPYHRQEHSLSCEIAALKMALDYYGLKISESDLIKELVFNTKDSRSKNNIWGDPDLGFVGNIDGKIPNGGYGVYEDPIITLAVKYKNAKKISGSDLSVILKEVSAKHPVIVWGSTASGKDISWRTETGKKVKAVYGEHARLIIGFAGTINKPTAIILHDPIYGTIRMSRENFLRDWSLLDNKAVVIF